MVYYKERVVSRRSVTAVVPSLQINFQFVSLTILRSSRWHTAVARHRVPDVEIVLVLFVQLAKFVRAQYHYAVY